MPQERKEEEKKINEKKEKKGRELDRLFAGIIHCCTIHCSYLVPR